MPAPSLPAAHTVAIIGGGASGTLVAAQLLRQADRPLQVYLISREQPIGRGVAYGTDCLDHLLNVPAGRMGALPSHPGGFLEWVNTRIGLPRFPTQPAGPEDFLPRCLYGAYLHAVLSTAVQKAAARVCLEPVNGEAVDIEELPEGGGSILLADGRRIEADRIVLALGLLPGEYPIAKPLPFYKSKHYVHLPWTRLAYDDLDRDADVLLVGAGLTAVDLALELPRLGHRGRIHALSRRGLQPRAHTTPQTWRDFLADGPLPATPRAALRLIRAEIARAAEAGIAWQAVIDAIRPHTQKLWGSWSWREKSRFLRHLRPYWENHRHRLAPAVADKIAQFQKDGRLIPYAGRLVSLTDKGHDAEAVFRLRNSDQEVTLRVSKVINCTGPRTDYSKYQHPLFVNLLARGLIDHDPIALGLNAGPAGRILRYCGGPVGWLHSLGATLKGVLWESTAIPEIRVQAEDIARDILAGEASMRR